MNVNRFARDLSGTDVDCFREWDELEVDGSFWWSFCCRWIDWWIVLKGWLRVQLIVARRRR